MLLGKSEMRLEEYEQIKAQINSARHHLDKVQGAMEEAGSLLIGVVDRTGNRQIAELHDLIHDKLEPISVVEEYLRLVVLPTLEKHKPTKWFWK